MEKNVRSWHIWVTFLFPLLYFLNAVTPWAAGLWGGADRSYYLPFWIGVMVLHWVSALIVWRFMKKDGISPVDIGLWLSARGIRVIIISLVVAALAIFFYTEAQVSAGTVIPAGLISMFFPLTTTERIFWIFCCFSAGFCEELVYRGYNISMLRFKGMNKWLSVLIAVPPFILIHSFAPIFSGYLFGMYFSAGIIFGLIYVLTKRLWIPMAIHCVYNLTAMMAVLGN